TPGVNGDWSIKDILAHLVSWQKRTLAYLDAAARQGKPDIEGISSDAEMNNLNARFYAGNRSRPLADVMTDFKNTYAQVVAAVEALSADDLIEPNRFAWLNGDPLWEQVAGNTYEHIDEHIGSIQAWLAASHQA
ncbi:MAG: ClbS/DfsB family four-helix bundle protein, partial [Ktedonobacteraceae bacterium]